jgi:hypothetical protein
VEIYGRVHVDSSMVIIHLHTQRCQLYNSWQNPHIHLTSPLPTFFYSQKLKITLKGRSLQTVEDIITNATNDLKAIPQTSFHQFFQKWKGWWEKFIAMQGYCFEGYTIQ